MSAGEDVLDAVNRLRPSGAGRLVVALDGYSGAGKSTLADQLAKELDAVVVRCDDFYRDMSDDDRRALTPAGGAAEYFDWERMRDEAIRPLRDGKPAVFRCFDWSANHGLTEAIRLEPKSVVVVEGVYSARPQLVDLLDLCVLVETFDDERRLRRSARHDPHEWMARWDVAEEYYFSLIRPPVSFDLVVPGF